VGGIKFLGWKATKTVGAEIPLARAGAWIERRQPPGSDGASPYRAERPVLMRDSTAGRPVLM
jgi:hypothetical protein